MTDHYVGRRLSFDGARCTVLYHGPVHGRKGDWYGVEWDDSRGRGKNDGSYEGVRYFKCFSDSPTAGSLIRPSRPSDKPLSFLAALNKKYVSNETNGITLPGNSIRISGKTVEEVGFEKIRQKLATLQDLRIVILDGLCIAGVEDHPGVKNLDEWHRIRSQGLKIVDLDLSRNLLEEWAHVAGICSAVGRSLRSLKLDENIIWDLNHPEVAEWREPFPNVTELSLCATRFSWQNVIKVVPAFPLLTILSFSSNNLGTLHGHLPTPHLRILDLSSNSFTSLGALTRLSSLQYLEKLSLRSNPITTLDISPSKVYFPCLKSLDLTLTHLPTLSSLHPIPTIFPNLISLLTNHAPLTNFPSSKLLTIARLSTLTELNYAPITPAERQNAELYYLSTIAKQLAAATDSQKEKQIIEQHPRWTDLCTIHGEPSIARKRDEEAGAGSLAARVTEFTFYITEADLKKAREQSPSISDKIKETLRTNIDSRVVEKTKLVPSTVDVYRLKGIVGRLFGIQPMGCKLIWETGEWDPVGGQEEEEGWSVSEDESESGEESDKVLTKALQGKDGGQQKDGDKSRWERREMELVDGTREVGFWVEGKEARIRVMLREKESV